MKLLDMKLNEFIDTVHLIAVNGVRVKEGALDLLEEHYESQMVKENVPFIEIPKRMDDLVNGVKEQVFNSLTVTQPIHPIFIVNEHGQYRGAFLFYREDVMSNPDYIQGDKPFYARSYSHEFQMAMRIKRYRGCVYKYFHHSLTLWDTVSLITKLKETDFTANNTLIGGGDEKALYDYYSV
ncbi:hypothetical protein AB6D11_00090 [Vibrio splendidus]